MSKYPAHWYGEVESELPAGVGETFEKSVARMDAMKMKIWNAEKHRVRACAYCGHRMISLKRLKKNRKTMFTMAWVSIEPGDPGRALPFHRQFNGVHGTLKHQEHRCEESIAARNVDVGFSPDPRNNRR
jgi:hypothetical protein